jgi:hypothetical protein
MYLSEKVTNIEIQESDQGVVLCIVGCRPVAMRWLRKQRPLLGNARNMHTTVEELRFLLVRAQGLKAGKWEPCES